MSILGQREAQEFDPGHVRFEKSFSSPSGDVKAAFAYKGPEYIKDDLSENIS